MSAARQADRPATGPGTAASAAFGRCVVPRDAARRAISSAGARSEEEAVAALLDPATLPPESEAEARALAEDLVRTLRRATPDAVTAAIRGFPMSGRSGTALMTLAEAYLRIPDDATRAALLSDRLSASDWRDGQGGALVGGLSRALRLASSTLATPSLAPLATPLLGRAVGVAMRRLGGQFVAGRTIGEAIRRGRRRERQGFTHSYDMLGEAAVSDAQAAFHERLYREAIEAIGRQRPGAPLLARPGLSIKLSALHPRYVRAQRDAVLDELYPRLLALAVRARALEVGLNIDAEEAERLDLSLDLLERLCHAPELAGWDGIGFVVQAYQTRALAVLDWLEQLAEATGRRLMVRLVKGAYWDTEIKRAQELGLAHFPVFTRKAHSDASYVACARRLLAAPSRFYPQFATHNARTIATIVAMSRNLGVEPGGFEFQCLHGMGEPIHREVMRRTGVSCRIYAPVGDHERLLSYLVRRLLENGANSSFVNRIADPAFTPAALAADPVEAIRSRSPVGQADPRVVPADAMFGTVRANSSGFDLSDEIVLDRLLGGAIAEAAARPARAAPDGRDEPGASVPNPADPDDVVGHVVEAEETDIARAFEDARAAQPAWQATAPARRAGILRDAADGLERAHPRLIGLIVREAGRTVPAAIAELREAVDFLRFYAREAETALGPDDRALGVVVCISPWNFPLAIFVGQVAAALAAGNAVLAKPAEQTPLVAAEAVSLLRAAGVPAAVLRLLPGDGRVGAALIAGDRCDGVMFTGSGEAARHIAVTLATDGAARPRAVPLVAETGGLNAMVTDSSALAEAVVRDAVASAFDSAGQRCSSLRLLCVAASHADRIVSLLTGAMDRLVVGDPSDLATDVGPLIDDAAAERVRAHVASMRRRGMRVHAAPLPGALAAADAGRFVPPTMIEIDRIDDLEGEVFGPVLHVVRVRDDELPSVLASLEARRFGLTFGIQSRIDARIAALARRAPAGNVYVNRNMIGAVVGVQPFGGHGRSGTGPKAGGPWLLHRLCDGGVPRGRPAEAGAAAPASADARLDRYLAHLATVDPEARDEVAQAARRLHALGGDRAVLLDGPTGEADEWTIEPRGEVLCVAAGAHERRVQVGLALASSNRATILSADEAAQEWFGFARVVRRTAEAVADAMLFAGDGSTRASLVRQVDSELETVVPLFERGPDGSYPVEWLLRERLVSTDTSAGCGNAALLSLQ